MLVIRDEGHFVLIRGLDRTDGAYLPADITSAADKLGINFSILAY